MHRGGRALTEDAEGPRMSMAMRRQLGMAPSKSPSKASSAAGCEALLPRRLHSIPSCDCNAECVMAMTLLGDCHSRLPPKRNSAAACKTPQSCTCLGHCMCLSHGTGNVAKPMVRAKSYGLTVVDGSSYAALLWQNIVCTCLALVSCCGCSCSAGGWRQPTEGARFACHVTFPVCHSALSSSR